MSVQESDRPDERAESQHGQERTEILQIIPAHGWSAVFVGLRGDRPEAYVETVACWALVEKTESDGDSYRYVVGLAVPTRGGMLPAAEDAEGPTFLAYIREGADLTEWHAKAKSAYETRPDIREAFEKLAELRAGAGETPPG